MDARGRQIKRAGDSAIASRAGASETCELVSGPRMGTRLQVLLPSVARFGAPVPRCRKVSDPQGQLREVLRPRASCRPDDPFCSLRSRRAISIGSLLSTSRETSRSNSYSGDRISASMIYDGQIFLLAADQAGDTVPAAHGALARVHARHSIK